MKAASLPNSTGALLFAGNCLTFAFHAALHRLGAAFAPQRRPGKVWLVGAGPGDAELLTLRALKLLKRADAIIHDHLVSAEILALARPRARKICVGKRAGRHSMAQGEINALLVREARRHGTVVRLKGGDPGIFGRAGEEISCLRACGIDYAIVPGITAASGCAAAVGITLTHRDMARAVHFATGHLAEDSGAQIDWARLADPQGTLVLYMAKSSLQRHAVQLLKAGMAPHTPVLVIADGTLKSQSAQLSTLAQCARGGVGEPASCPALIIIGEVAGQADLTRERQPYRGLLLERVKGIEPSS